MSTRNNDYSHRFKNIADFAIRKQKPTLPQLLGLFLIILVFCLILTLLNPDKKPIIVSLFFVLAALGSYIIVLLQSSRDLVLTTEFQNALFASALDYNRTFCLIIKNDGNIVYMDRSFQKIFPDFIKDGHLSLMNFLKHAEVASADAEKIFSGVERSVGDKVICTMVGSDGRAYKLVISIEPIPRPAGFIMLHSREYVEQRTEKADAPARTTATILFSKSTLALFSSIMDKMNTGIYVVDLKGNIIYANSTLEHWLAYRENEIAYGNFSLKDVVRYDDIETGTIMPEDFDGEIILRKKAGGFLRVFINQKMIRGEAGEALGCMAMIAPIAEGDTSTKKRVW